ncbi:MAG: restriction endonuclease subunit S [Spirochaetaceae bacterium]|nr:restriction endonuclease subunit S [Spirochaetaceae bacterium]
MTDGLKDEHREAIIAGIAANDRVERAVLFGSRATGTNTVSSDVNIALFGDRLTLTDQSRLAAALDEIPMAQEIDLVLYDSIRDHALREQIQRDGVEWYAEPNDRSDQVTLTSATGAGNLSDPPSGWERSTLGEVCKRSGGNIQTGPFGSQLHASDYRPEGIPSIMPQNLGDNRVIEVGISRIGELDASRLRRYLVREGDIVYSRRGDVERRALIGPREDGWLCGTGCLRVRLGENGVDPTYASYYLGNPAVREWIVRHAHGATMPNLNTAILSACPFVVPPPSEQRAIAHVLGTLDDKIELSRLMNATLEAMVHELFRSWFVDFDPVRAKMERRDSRLPMEIADLFPDRLADSEVGEIPKGWTVQTLGDIAAAPRRGVHPARVSCDTPFIGLEHMPRGSVALGDWGTSAGVSSGKFAFDSRDILFGKLRPYFHKVGVAPVNGVCSTDIVVLKPRMPTWSTFVLACVSSSRFVSYANQSSTGTKMPRTSWETMSRYELCRPTDAIVQAFHQVVSPMLEQIVSNVHESRTTAALRDVLLPLLTSGEIRVGHLPTK